MKRINASVPDEYADKAQELANQQRRSLSSWVALLVVDALDAKDDLRRGQWLFITARNAFPAQVQEIIGSEADCFYDDTKAAAFLSRLVQLVALDKEPEQ